LAAILQISIFRAFHRKLPSRLVAGLLLFNPLVVHAMSAETADDQAASVRAKTSAIIQNGFELTQDGSFKLKLKNDHDQMQVSIQNCDRESLEIDEKCVLTIYELQ
jgi:hypothetical protein